MPDELAMGNLPRKLYLHVGPAKTGTTIIQSTLAEHDNSVVLYPKVGLAGSGAHHNLLWNFHGQRGRRQFVEADINELFAEIGQIATDSPLNIVISSESMMPPGDAAKDIAANLDSFIRSLLPHFGPDPPEVEIVVVVREHFERAASYYSNQLQRRLRKGFKMTPDEVLLNCSQDLCYAETLIELAKLNLTVTVLNYSPREDWLHRFLKHVGFGEGPFPEISSRNISFAPATLIARLAANSVFSNDEEIREFMAELKDTLKSRSPSQFIFGKSAAAAADRIFGADREFLRENCGIVLAPPDIETEENMFFLDPPAFAEIAAAAASHGRKGKQIVEFAGRFVRQEQLSSQGQISPLSSMPG